MAFDSDLKTNVNKYIKSHLTIDNYKGLLSFIDNNLLKSEIEKELYSIRYIYKILEGLQVQNELQVMQAKIQILSYSSIYEAIIDYLLFEKFSNDEKVENLLKKTTYKQISLPKKCDKYKNHDGKEVLFMFKTNDKRDQREVKFKEKLNVLFEIIDFNIYIKDKKGNEILKITSEDLKNELETFYDYRNMIHVYKKLRDNEKDYKEYTLELSKLAFWRLKPFLEKINDFMKDLKNEI